MTQFRAKVVVVTGASAGVGRATAVAFGHQRAKVALLARGSVGLDEAAREVTQAGGQALVIRTDVADAGQVDAAADQVVATLGPIEVWVNSAMVTMFSPFKRMVNEEFDRITQVTYLGAVYGTRAALRHMRPLNHGRIIQVGSALAYRSIPLQSAYCGAKAAVRGFTDAVRVELMHEKSNILISMVQLGAVNTPQFEWARSRLHARPQPLPPIYQPEVAAESILLAASQGRREVWSTFSTFRTIVGGFLLPGIGDKLALKQAYSGQKDTESTLPDNRPDNLYTAVDRDFGAHGRFDDQAKGSSWYLKASEHRTPLLFGALALVAAWGSRLLIKRVGGDL